MKAKLIKVLDQYHLYDGDKAIATTIVGNPMLLPNLSKQNCDEIFGVVDVDKLAFYEFPNGNINGETSIEQKIRQSAFKVGFNKAMELNKDKLFTLEQMSVAYNTNRSGTLFEQLINSFGGQPTEIEVEIVMDICGDKVHAVPDPKIDENGCLILKRVV